MIAIKNNLLSGILQLPDWFCNYYDPRENKRIYTKKIIIFYYKRKRNQLKRGYFYAVHNCKSN